MDFKTHAVSLEVKRLEVKEEDGKKVAVFEGYGSIFGNKDSNGDVVVSGAFSRSLQQRGMPAMLWMHNSDKPIGVFTEAREDGVGLFVSGEINLDTQLGKEAYSLLKQGAVKGLSIGYNVVKFTERSGVRYLEDVELWEVSLVTFPANALANVTGVKSCDSVREFERLMRWFGFSRSEAKAIAAKGFSGLQDCREGGDVAGDADDVQRDAELSEVIGRLSEGLGELKQLMKG